MTRFACLLLLALGVTIAQPAYTQTSSPQASDRPPLGSTVTADLLADLPASASLYSLLDSVTPDVIGDHIDSGGLSTGEPGRLGGHGSSWTQTMFRVGGADITDPSGGGTPLIVPDLSAWERVDVATGLLPIDINAPGLAILLTPRRPSPSWTRELELLGSPPGLIARRADAVPPPIARLDIWAHANLLLSGPLIPNRLGLLLVSNWTRSARIERNAPTPAHASLGSLFANLVFTPGPRDEWQLVGWAQRAVSPFEHRTAFAQPKALDRDTSFHVHAAWERRASKDGLWRAFGSYTGRHRVPEVAQTPTLMVERLTDGPVSQLLYAGQGSDRTWSLGINARSTPATLRGGPHAWLAGSEVTGGAVRAEPAALQRVAETVDGVPARVWDFAGSRESRWHDITMAAYVSDSFEIWPRVTLDLALRFEAVAGSAAGGTTGVSWRNWLPRGGIRYDLVPAAHLTTFIDFSRYGYRLPLRHLAYGDANAPAGVVRRWSGAALPPPGTPVGGAIVMRVGPGTGGDPRFSAIDPELDRPYMDEITTGFEWRPQPAMLYRITGLARREQRLLGVVDIGAPEGAYSVSRIPDAGVDLAGAGDDQLLPIYNRLRSTFGADRYLVTNPADEPTTFVGVDVSGQVRAGRLVLLAGGTAGRSEGISANRGFQPVENDQGILGDVFIDPNARTFARGRLFTERGYTIKTAGSYRFPKDATLGIVARYQDGQHFARLVIVPDLDQGAEAIRAFPNGKTRFTYTMTIDVRVQKAFAVSTRRMTVLADAYNLLNRAKEVEEFPVTGPMSRLTAAVQPPRAVHVGLKIRF